jgi:hypothetical protein
MTMSGSPTDTQQQEQQCVICGTATKYPLELNEQFFCSSACLSKYRDQVGHHQFHRDTLATFEQKRKKGGIPERALLYNSMCRRCHKKMAAACKTNQYINGLHRDELRQTETAAWCCHARFNLSSSLSDGSVPLEAARKIQAMAEEIVRNQEVCERVVGPEDLREKMAKPGGLHGVTTTILDIAAAELALNPGYQPRADHTPAPEDGEFMVHYAACLECDPAFAAECHEQAEEKEINKCLDEVQAMTSERWCEHTLNALSALRLNRNMSREKLQAIVASAERVKEEKEDFGVTTRHLFITLGRAVQA